MTLYNSSISQTDIYQIWQNQLLDALGVTRWVSQHSPAIDVSAIDITTLIDNQTFTTPVESVETIATPVVDEVVIVDNPPEIPNYYFFDDDNDEQLSTYSQTTIRQSIIVAPFQLQALIINHWILLADSKILSANLEQSQLWQTIAHNLNGYMQTFDFPLIRHQEILADKYIQQMSDCLLAVASFQGFICKLQQPAWHTGGYQMGAVTALPDCLAHQNIQSLPTLAEILVDNNQKRQLWTRIREVVV